MSGRGEIEVVALGADDWPRWRALRLAALTQDPQAFGDTLARWTGANDTEERWRSRWTGVAHNLLAALDGVEVGVVGLRVPPGDAPLELLSMWVAPTARGHGVGDALIDAVVALAGRTGPRRAVALSVVEDNRHARHLYARHGFVDVGPSPDDPRELRMLRRS